MDYIGGKIMPFFTAIKDASSGKTKKEKTSNSFKNL